MLGHTTLTDDEFLAAFEQCRLPKDLWTHEAHVRMASLYLSREPLEDVLSKVSNGIRQYNASLGNVAGYRETVTQAYLLLIASRIGNGGARFDDFKRRHPKLFDRKDPILLWHYRKETLDSIEAKEQFVPPDFEPLPSSAYSRRMAALMRQDLDHRGKQVRSQLVSEWGDKQCSKSPSWSPPTTIKFSAFGGSQRASA